MISALGIQRILLSASGKMGTVDVTSKHVSIGSRKKSGKLRISPFASTKDQSSRTIPNKYNFNATAESFEIGIDELNNLIEFVKLREFDAQVLIVPSSTGVHSGGCFNWSGANNTIGLDFEYVLSDKERFCKVVLEGAKDKGDAIAFIQQSTIGTLTPSLASLPAFGSNEEGVNINKAKTPWYMSIKANDGELFPKKEISARSLVLATKGRKIEQYNESIGDFISVKLELTGLDATPGKIAQLMSLPLSPSLEIKERISATEYEQISIPLNKLGVDVEAEMGDEKSESKVILEGDIPLRLWSNYATKVTG